MLFLTACGGGMKKGQTPESSQTSTTSKPPREDIDSRLVGAWRYDGTYWYYNVAYARITIYSFYANGTFECRDGTFNIRTFKGNYTTSGSKIYFTDIINNRHYTATDVYTDFEDYPNVTMEYDIGTNGDSGFLSISIMGTWDDRTAFDMSTTSKFKKQ